MGYLQDNLPYGVSVGDCPELYPYALAVKWLVNDPFTAPSIVDRVGLLVKEVLPDVEDWQFSVIKSRQDRVKLRFKDEGSRTLARNKLAVNGEFEFHITQLVDLNPPDRATRGIA
jgi:hypothetical protein